MSDNDEDRPHTPILFPEERAHRVPIFGEQYQNSTAIPLILHTKEEAIDWLNKFYACITINGKYYVLHEKSDETIEFMNITDFKNSLAEMRIDVTSSDGTKTKQTPITELWLISPNRRRFDNGIIFDPSRVGHYGDMYNLFKGWPIAPREGNCEIFLNYIKEIICSNNEENYKYLITLVAQMFQFPNKKPGVAVVIRGEEGVGKSFFVEKLGYLMGPYYFKTSNPSYVFGDHNGQLKDKLLLHLEEAIWAGSNKDESLLKDLITGLTIEINDKYVPVYSVPNHLHLFITGNPDWLVKANFRARRLFALHASEKRKKDIPFFAALDNWFTKEGGAAALMHYFLKYDISGLELRNVPVTDELIQQTKRSLSGAKEWFVDIFESHEMPCGYLVGDEQEVEYDDYELDKNGTLVPVKKKEKVKINARVRVPKDWLYKDYCDSKAGKRHPLNKSEFGIQFLALLPLVVRGVVQMSADGKRPKSIVKSDIKVRDNMNIRRDGYEMPIWKEVKDAISFQFGALTTSSDEEWTIRVDDFPEIDMQKKRNKDRNRSSM
jgi:hypothetical protein